MTLVQLRIFLAVAELGNVTKASKELGISQSAASAAIATIEDIYQVKLFDRVGRSVFLSDLGTLIIVGHIWLLLLDLL